MFLCMCEYLCECVCGSKWPVILLLPLHALVPMRVGSSQSSKKQAVRGITPQRSGNALIYSPEEPYENKNWRTGPLTLTRGHWGNNATHLATQKSPEASYSAVFMVTSFSRSLKRLCNIHKSPLPVKGES